MLINETGPAHNKEFTMIVKIDDIVYGKGVASTKKEAEQEAARDALKKIGNYLLHFNMFSVFIATISIA